MSTIVVLAGGLSHERDVSLRSGRRAVLALRELGHRVIEADVNADLVTLLASVEDPVVVPMLHGGLGEDGALREVLDLLRVPYVGSNAPAARMTFDKSIATPLVAAAGLATPKQVALPHDIFRELGAQALVRALANEVGLPLMVKPSRSGSALGCTKVVAAEQLPAAMVAAYAYGSVAVVEEFIEGTEIAVAVVDTGDGPVALPAVEIRPEKGVYDYDARYTAGTTQFVTPAELPAEVADEAGKLALAAFDVLGLRQLSRIDIIVRDGVPVFIEANVAPGMTETSLVPLALESAGLGLGELLSTLVARCA
ncbi:MAG: D-alanine--D-alanine ligase [Propionibacteriaceae bacterium]|nr:D-alanine--D-alanine ligase [Propionibacteriaceae bacterium]